MRRKVDTIVTSGRGPRGRASDVGHPDCVRDGSGPSRRRLGRVFGETRQATLLVCPASQPILPASGHAEPNGAVLANRRRSSLPTKLRSSCGPLPQRRGLRRRYAPSRASALHGVYDRCDAACRAVDGAASDLTRRAPAMSRRVRKGHLTERDRGSRREADHETNLPVR